MIGLKKGIQVARILEYYSGPCVPLERGLRTVVEECMEHSPLLLHSKDCVEGTPQYLHKGDGHFMIYTGKM